MIYFSLELTRSLEFCTVTKKKIIQTWTSIKYENICFSLFDPLYIVRNNLTKRGLKRSLNPTWRWMMELRSPVQYLHATAVQGDINGKETKKYQPSFLLRGMRWAFKNPIPRFVKSPWLLPGPSLQTETHFPDPETWTEKGRTARSSAKRPWASEAYPTTMARAVERRHK